MKIIAVVTFGFVWLVAAFLLPQRSVAVSPSATDDVIRLEARWITAILNGDRATVAAILSSDFKHILNNGEIIDREQELASINKEPFVIALSEQTVDFDSTGHAAALHGLDTITEPGKPVRHQRFTDVFFKEKGTWMAVSAQENVITP